MEPPAARPEPADPDYTLFNREAFLSGNALPNSFQWRDAQRLRSAGMRIVRSAHYPQAPAFMDACDEFGVLAIVSTPGWQWFPKCAAFNERAWRNTREMVRLHRNRPSVILWEVGLNETSYTKEYAETAHRIVHEEYPGPFCYTSGDASLDWQKETPVFDVLYHELVSPARRPLWSREWGDAVDMNWRDQISNNRASRAMGEEAMLLQSRSLLGTLRYVLEANHLGSGLWAGIDCDRGYHPIPFLGGLLDNARLPKFVWYGFASQRPAAVRIPGLDDGPMVFIANFMNHYSPRDIIVYSNCEQVRLLMSRGAGNGGKGATAEKEVGTLPVTRLGKLPHAPTVFTKVYETIDRCRLKAQGLIGGKVVAEYSLGAAGAPRKLVLTADRCGRDLVADGSDIAPVFASIRDAEENTVTFDDRNVVFTVTGPGAVVGDAAIGANPCRTELGIAPVLIRAATRPGKIMVTAKAQGLLPAELILESVPLQQAVVRGRDVGCEPSPKQEQTARAPGNPAQVPCEEMMQSQQKSQEMRDKQ